MITSLHFSQLNLQQEVAQRIDAIAAELAELRQAGELQIEISPSDLFYIEALGYTVDLSSGLLSRAEQTAPATPLVKQTALC